MHLLSNQTYDLWYTDDDYQVQEFSLQIDNSKIKRVKGQRYLGLTLDEHIKVLLKFLAYSYTII